MKIAVTYENGNVFPHFGRTENFKIYEVLGGSIASSEIISAGGAGHEALAGFLADKGIDILICGGCGEGAKAALDEAGIAVYSGAEGSADEAVDAFLRGELISAGVNCDHHEEKEEAEEACGSCGGNCGSCGGCGSRQPIMEGKNVGKTVRVHYCGTFDDGSQFDSSYDRGEPLEYTCGVGMMIRGFDQAVADMEAGETRKVHLMPEEAYGEKDPDAIFSLNVNDLPGSENLKVGDRAYLTNIYGQQFAVTVTAREDDSITFDANHEMAGKELNFSIELLEVLE